MPWIRCESCKRTTKAVIVAMPSEDKTYRFVARCAACGNTSLPSGTAAEAVEQLGKPRIGGEDDLGHFIPAGSARRL